jgi:hypothetical protein
MRLAFALVRAFPALSFLAMMPAKAQTFLNWPIVFKDGMTGNDIGNGYPSYTGKTRADWFYNVKQCCGGDDYRPLSMYSTATPCTNEPVEAFPVNSKMAIRMEYVAGSNPNYPNGCWVSGILSSMDANNTHGESFVVGKGLFFECSVKLPGPAKGTWPSCWSTSTVANSSGGRDELDIFEQYSVYGNAVSINMTNHGTGVDYTNGGCNPSLPATLSSAAHAYGVQMVPVATGLQVSFYFDRVQIAGDNCTFIIPNSGSKADTSWTSLPFELIMDLGVGQQGYAGASAPNQPGYANTGMPKLSYMTFEAASAASDNPGWEVRQAP